MSGFASVCLLRSSSQQWIASPPLAWAAEVVVVVAVEWVGAAEVDSPAAGEHAPPVDSVAEEVLVAAVVADSQEEPDLRSEALLR